jgi:large subunit ribosomal protein L19
MDLLDLVDRKHRRDEERNENGEVAFSVPEFRTGDLIDVHVRIVEGDNERVQVFRGTVIQRHAGASINASFTVRKVTAGVGIERIFPLHSPRIAKIDVIRRGRVRRARIYYLRDLRGKAARVSEKRDLRTVEQKAAAAETR